MPQIPSSDLSALSMAVVIVNYRSAHLVIDHLEAVRQELTPFQSGQVIIVDNKSPGEDADALEKATAPFDDVVVIRSPKNGGFAYGNNRGLEAAGEADLVFFLNPDACPRPGSVMRLATTLLETERAGVVGPRLVSSTGEERASAFRRLSPGFVYLLNGGVGGRLFAGHSDIAMDVAEGEVTSTTWIPGAAMMVSREALDAVGGMDEGYFLYFEETDWLEAIGRAGFDVLADSRAVVEHIEGQSTGVVSNSGARSDLPLYWYQSWRRFWLKNRSRPVAALAAFAFLAGQMTDRVRRRLTGAGPRTGGPRIRTFTRQCFLPILFGGAP